MFDIKKQLRWSKVKVGLVITLALLALLLAVFFAGNIQNLFLKKLEIKAQIQDVNGLRKGSPVWIFGTEIGLVKNIHLHPEHGTIVTLAVYRDALPFVRKDSLATVLSMGLLVDKYIELSAGSPRADAIQPGDTIKGTTQTELRDVMETSSRAIQKMTEFIEKMDHLVSKVEKGEGTLAKLLTDPALYDHLEKTTRNLSLTIGEIRESRGTLNRLIEDPTLYHKMTAAASVLEEFGSRLKTGEGTLRKIIEDPSLYDKAVGVVSGLEKFSSKLNEGDGTLKRMIEDPSLYEKMTAAVTGLEDFSKELRERQGTLRKLLEDPELYENLNKGSKHLASIASRVDQGEGTAGALIRDDQLARELKETFGKVRELTGELDGLAVEMKNLLKDIKDHPKKYFKFSIF